MDYRKIKIIIYCVLLLVVIVRVYFSFKNDRGIIVDKYKNKIVDIIGVVSNEPITKDFNKIFSLKVKTIDDKSVDLYIKVQSDRYGEYEYGEMVKLRGKLLIPFNFKSDSGREFDYVNFLLKDKIYFEIKNPQISVLEYGYGNPVSSYLFNFKKSFLDNIKTVLGEPHGALAGGLVVGEKSALGKDLLDDFRKVGLIHIVVLSGYNITIISDSIMRLLSFLPKRIGILFGALSIIAFGILVGGGATVVRSCIMAIIALLSKLFNRDYVVMESLVIAGILMVIQNPMIVLHDPSFQLSFLATLGLILVSPRIEKRITFVTENFGIRGLLSSTLATQIFVSPYLLYMMGNLSVIGILVNILVLPIIPLTMLFVALAGLLGFISENISIVFGWLSHLLLTYELYIVRIFSKISFSSISLPKFSFYIVVLVYSIYFIALSKLPSILFQFRFKKKSST